jgi:DNA-binding GntR family transcriptional regulator
LNGSGTLKDNALYGVAFCSIDCRKGHPINQNGFGQLDQNVEDTHTLRQTSSPEEVFRDVVRGLYDGRYAPGQRLIEADISRDYGVSRGTAREALKRLGAEGLVTTNLHRSARIRRLNRQEIKDILEIVELLTGYSCHRCAGRMTDPRQREAFANHYNAVMSFKDSENLPGFIKARNRFFRALVDLSGNSELQRLMPTLHLHLIRVQLKNSEVDDMMMWFESYRDIAEAVLEGDATRAEEAGRSHVRRFAELTEQLPERLFAF